MISRQERSRAARGALLIEQAVGAVVWVGGALSTLLILVALAIMSYAVLQRYFFGRPVLWSDELIGYGLILLIMMGVAEAYRKGDHIAIDVLTEKLYGRRRHLVELWADLAVLTISVILFVSAWHAISFARAFGSYTTGNIEVASWIVRLPLLAGFALLGALAAARLLSRLTGAKR